LIQSKCVRKVGLFDPVFYHYGEDEDYCNRMRYHGYKIGVCPKQYIFHDRADRDLEKPSLFNKDVMERTILIDVINPLNEKYSQRLANMKKNIQRNVLTSILQLKFGRAVKNYNKLIKHKLFQKQVHARRETNKKGESHL
jgi:GT2 family glycosyltransferase